jgi:hypothetical protein
MASKLVGLLGFCVRSNIESLEDVRAKDTSHVRWEDNPETATVRLAKGVPRNWKWKLTS